MSTKTNAGTQFYIGPANSTAATQNDYEGLTYSEVGEVLDIPQFGDMAEVIRANVLNDGRVKKAVGTKDAGDLTIPYLFDPADTGQSDLDSVAGTDTEYAFKVELDDEGSGSPSNATAFYFRAKVLGTRRTVGPANNFVQADAMLTLTSAVVQVDAV